MFGFNAGPERVTRATIRAGCHIRQLMVGCARNGTLRKNFAPRLPKAEVHWCMVGRDRQNCAYIEKWMLILLCGKLIRCLQASSLEFTSDWAQVCAGNRTHIIMVTGHFTSWCWGPAAPALSTELIASPFNG